MKSPLYRLLQISLAGGVLAGSVSTTGCVESRDHRNGVFDENQYIRKSFLVRDKDQDPGWIVQGTILQVSSPNPFGNLGLYPGYYNSQIFKFNVTSDKLEMLSLRSLYKEPDISRTDATINAWPATNVDLKFRINLDGETTNFYEENQEQPWDRRQFIKLQVAKNDLSDFAVIDPTYLTDSLKRCVDYGNASSTLVPKSFKVDEKNDYMEWKVAVTLPFSVEDPVCGSLLNEAGMVDRASVTATVMYSFKRLEPVEARDYHPLEVAEKDPIRRKYGAFETLDVKYGPRDIAPGDEDPNLIGNSGLLSARQLLNRFNPKKDIIYYFEAGLPEQYKPVFTGPDGIAAQTNAIFEKIGVPARLHFKEADADLPPGSPPREFGDIRYNFVRWMKDPGLHAPFTGLGQTIADPRTGEKLKSTVVIFDDGLKDLAFMYDHLLTTLGASEGLTTTNDEGDALDKPWPALQEPCTNGDTVKINPTILSRRHNQSTLFNKLQQYLNKPATLYGNLGPSDFVIEPHPEYKDTYFDLLPHFVYGDPFANAFVTPEGGGGVFGPSTAQLWEMREKEVRFRKLMGDIDRGIAPFADVEGPEGVVAATNFANDFRMLTQNHMMLDYVEQNLFRREMDPAPDLLSAYLRGARRCVNGKWETRTQWMRRWIDEYYTRVLWHEFGHDMGLRHNFMGSVDRRNWPRYTDEAGEHWADTSSSVMEYSSVFADSAYKPGWGPYDRAAIAWLYSNEQKKGTSASGTGTFSVSGQKNAQEPWNDPYGFTADGKEIPYLFCTDENVTRTPLCQRRDYGTTPAQITASFVDDYDWQYQFRNQRAFRKFHTLNSYGSTVATTVTNLRRFIPFAAEFGTVGDIIRKLKVTPPDGAPFQNWIDSITLELFDAIEHGNVITAAFHKAVIQQASGERPFSTHVDPRFGDVNVQGIIIDKVFAAQGWLGLSPVLDQNPNTTGRYSAPYTESISPAYTTVAHDTLDSVLGGGYDTYPWLIQANIALFAQDSHSQNFNINHSELKEWIAVQAFPREEQFLEFFEEKAHLAEFVGNDPVTGEPIDCRNGRHCTWDPRHFDDNLQTVTLPDGHTWVWMFIPSRNMYITTERDRSPIVFRRIREYTTLLAQGRGGNELWAAERPVKFYVDAYLKYR